MTTLKKLKAMPLLALAVLLTASMSDVRALPIDADGAFYAADYTSPSPMVRIDPTTGQSTPAVRAKTNLIHGLALAPPPQPPALRVEFEKWLATPGPAPYVATFEGLVAGDVNGRLVTRVLERVQVNTDLVTLKAHYVLYGSHDPAAAPVLVAEVAGQQVGAHAVLEGNVLGGWLADAPVRVEFDTVECAPGKERCYRGAVNIAAGPPAVYRLACRKWTTEWPRMAGTVEGDVPGTFGGEVLEATASADGKQLHLIARYDITAGEQSFSARVEGDQNNETRKAALTGTVTDGWYRGAQVMAEYDVTTCEGHDPCFSGVIRVIAIPAAINPTTRFQHTAVHRDQRVSFTTSATGIPPLTYQWHREGEELPGQTNKTLTITAAQAADEGDYSVKISNPGGTVLSPTARLYVVPPVAEFKLAAFTNATGQRLPYFIFVPPTYDLKQRYPLVCPFHGSGGNEQSLPGASGAFQQWPEMFVFASYRQQTTDPAIVVWPTRSASDADFTPRHRQLALELLDSLIATYSIDTNRIYTGGASAGTDDAWDALGLRPNFFAGALFWDGGSGSAKASSIKHIPGWGFGSAALGLVQSLRRAGGNPLYTEYKSADHSQTMRAAMCTPTAVDWLLAQRRGEPAKSPVVLSIDTPTQQPVFTSGRVTLDFAGSIDTTQGHVTQVAWVNLANRATGLAVATAGWNAANIPLVADKTNVIVITATLDTGWTPGFEGTTTFSDTLTVFSTPARLSLTLQGGEALLDWTGGVPPFRVERTANFSGSNWTELGSNLAPPIAIPLQTAMDFYRLIGQ